MEKSIEYIPLASLFVAAIAVLVGPWVSWKVSKAQSDNSLRVAKKQIVAPLRQAWIESLRNRVAEIISTSHWYYVSGASDSHEPSDDPEGDNPAGYEVDRKLVFLRRQVELMLNPQEEDHRKLNQFLSHVVSGATGNRDQRIHFGERCEEATSLCQTVLKREWERVKNEV